jgi:hypothetical protein
MSLLLRPYGWMFKLMANHSDKQQQKHFFYTEVSPGKHTVTSISENTDTVEVDAVGGKLYYIWQEVKFGFLYARTKLHLVNDADFI